MDRNEAIRFHTDRAVAELNLALEAAGGNAARSHLELSALHLAKLRDMKAPPPPMHLLQS